MISVVTPVYNESAGLKTVLEKLFQRLKNLSESWELIVVDDGSTDNSRKIAEEMARLHPEIISKGYRKHEGRGRAMREGFLAARGDILVTMEADGSWGDDIVEKLVRVLKEDSECDMVIASPHLPGGGYQNVPFWRTAISRIGNILLTRSFTGKVTMSTGMTRAYRRHVIDGMNLESKGKEIHLEILSKALALGYRVREIPAILSWSPGRKSRFPATNVFSSHLLFSFSEWPFLILGTSGLFFLVVGVLAGVITLIHQMISLHSGVDPRVYKPLINTVSIAVFVLVGVQILLFNFIAYQNKKTQDQLSRLEKDVHQLRSRN